MCLRYYRNVAWLKMARKGYKKIRKNMLLVLLFVWKERRNPRQSWLGIRLQNNLDRKRMPNPRVTEEIHAHFSWLTTDLGHIRVYSENYIKWIIVLKILRQTSNRLRTNFSINFKFMRYVYIYIYIYTHIYIYIYTGCFTTLGHNCRRWFPRSLWWKKFI